MGMALQYPGWRHINGDGHAGAEVTDGTSPVGLMSQHCPARAWGWRPYLFQGFRRPPSRGATWRPYEGGQHSVMELTPSHAAQPSIVLGMAAQSGLVEQHRDTIPKRCQSAAWRGFAFDPCACVVLEHLMLRLGGGHRGCGLWTASSEAEFRLRGRPAL
jgi:hypothetical protein